MHWNLKKFKVKDLKDHPKNPRRLSKDQADHLKTSIEKFGLIDKPICTKDGVLIGGHQRKNILKQMGVKEVECYVPSTDLTEEQIDELNVRLNRNVGEWDYDILANQWEIGDLLEWGFSAEELCMYMGETQDIDASEQPEKPKKKVVCPNCAHEF